MKTRIQVLISLLIAGFILAEQLQFWPSQIVQRLEWISYDQRVQHTQSFQADPNIVIVDIDESSIQRLGQWPWPREYVATLLETLYLDYHIQLAGLDIVFAEPQTNPWHQPLTSHHPELLEALDLTEGDDVLATTLSQFPVVTAYYFETQNRQQLPSSGQLSAPLQLSHGLPEHLAVPAPLRYTANLERLAAQSIGAGFFENPLTDSDGTVRRAAMLQQWQGELYPSLSLAMLYTLLGQMPVTLDIHETGLEGIDIGGFYVPTDAHGGALVPYYGPRATFTYISAADILNHTAPADTLANAIVLIGTSAPGLMDLRTTPVGAVYPGVEIHASLLAGMLAQEIKHEPVYSLAITVLLLTLLAILISLVFPHLNAVKLTLVSLLLLCAHLVINFTAWQQGLVLPLASGVLLILSLSGFHLTANLWRESADKQRVAQTFGRYIPPKLVADIVASPKAQDLQGREEVLTVLFSDIRGFTGFAEQIPAAELSDMMNKLLTPVTEAIHHQRGTIDKYMGDAVMAFWGAPLPDTQHAHHGVQAALNMQQAIQQFNQQYGHRLAMGIGLHTGTMNVGNMGSDYRMAYTVLGDNVNLGARIESLTKFYAVNIMISADTLAQLIQPSSASELAVNKSDWVTDAVGQVNQNPALPYHIRELDIAIVKGRQSPVTLLEVSPIPSSEPSPHASQNTLTEPMIRSSQRALHVYRQGAFRESLAAWQTHLSEFPHDRLAQIYIARCEAYIKTPPAENWGGVFRHYDK